MDDQAFIDAVKEHVFNSAVEDVLSQLDSPAGRKPADTTMQLSLWYNEQNDDSKAHIRQCVQEGAHAALFGFFCVLDGVRLIHEDLRHGELRLVLQTDAKEIVLADNQAISDLHDIFNAETSGA
ncbi:hypothetical protein [Cognatishimia activa]|uniref:Uncharacterized protein n=1 Tax=Cognatishimia activa TaxID=1715691 RepID=A0A0P1IW64_9RHOB|nr:hypothetical protein [Cognatishimia activa]CUI99151.1 hypothetical protein TA5113_01973 [Cognatishimia activa]CUK26243.1 hypothetical protein TA5114_02052 [Cognatishimia activa]